jgi:hypothetical protein
MPAMKKMKKTTIGKKSQFNTNTTNPTPSKGNGAKGFVMGNPQKPAMGAGAKPGAHGKAMGTRKGGGGRSY